MSPAQQALLNTGLLVNNDERRVFTTTEVGNRAIDAVIEFSDETRATYAKALEHFQTVRLARAVMLMGIGEVLVQEGGVG